MPKSPLGYFYSNLSKLKTNYNNKNHECAF